MIVNVPNLGVTPGVPDELRGAVTGLSFIFNMNLSNALEACLTFGVTKGAFCKNRDEHLFWDAIHPTKAAQRLIGNIAANQLPD